MAPKNSEKVANAESSSAEGAGSVSLSAPDIKILVAVLRNSTKAGSPHKDTVYWDRVYKDAQLKNVETAQRRMYQVCKKHGFFEADESGDGADAGGKPPNAKKEPVATKGKGKGKGKKRPAADEDASDAEDIDDHDGDETKKHPMKKAKKVKIAEDA